MRGAAALALASLVLATTTATDSADARARKKHRATHAAKVQHYAPPYASIVVDANTGKVLEENSSDSLRHPASLTKIMTLYLLFERMEAGKIKPSTELDVSQHASLQAPSKLGLKPGDTITVENAIRAIVTKSANDVAVVVAEALGGTENDFGKMMTRKAHALGMTQTVYLNASGLPNDDQVTTARDQVILGRAIQERFPKYYAYFSTRSFSFRGHAMRNHNKLLGAVEGVDGIKTGYTNASGFNLVTSVRRGGKHVVAAVFGGRTANWRDGRMRELISKYIRVASNERSAPQPDLVAQMKSDPGKTASTAPALMRTASAGEVPPAAYTLPPQGSTEPIKPNAVKTVKVKAAHMPALSPAGVEASGKMMPPAQSARVTTVVTVNARVPSPAADAPSVQEVSAVRRSGGYLIQVGAFDDEADARNRLALARSKAKDVLDIADPFTEKVAKGDKTMYRARFAGFDREQAEAACKSLRRGEIPCMTLKN